MIRRAASEDEEVEEEDEDEELSDRETTIASDSLSKDLYY